MKSAFRKLFFFLLLPVTGCLLLATILPSPAYAQVDCSGIPSTGQQGVDNYNKTAIKTQAMDDKIFNLNQWSGSVDSALVLLTGCSQIHPQTNIATSGTGALASTSALIALAYSSPPISGVNYLAQKIEQLNPVRPAYAQGIGYTALNPIQPIWTAFRNIAYVGFVLVFIVIGFMIMFRAKVSPQTVATVQDSIPRIMIALILVTFSYAIVGLMIDFMFLFLNVLINALPDSLIGRDQAYDVAFQQSIFGVFKDAWPDLIGTTANAIGSLINTVIGGSGGLLETILKWGVGGIAGVIVAIGGVFIMFRIFFMLLMAYASIVILTIFAPFLLLFQALPGNNGAMGWLKQVLANLAVFPVVAIMIILAGILGGIGAFGGKTDPALDTQRATQIGQFPLISGRINPAAVSSIIGLGILFMIPSAAGMIKERLKAGQGIAFGGAGAAALGTAAGVAYTGSGARSGVGAVSGAFGAASREQHEILAGRIPVIGTAAREKRAAIMGQNRATDR